MAKVYLSAPQHWYNACAVAGCDENTHNNDYLDELEVYLRACGIETRRSYRRPPRDSSTDGDELMIRAVQESDAWGADVHYVSHTNAYNGSVRGYRPMIFPGSARGRKLAELMIAQRRKIYDQPISLTERSDLYELRVPNAASYYEEHVFHDNAADAQCFHANMRAIAESAARGLCEYFGIPFVDPYAAVETAEVAIPVLSRGSSGTAARALMVLLRDQGFYTAALPDDDDFFGPAADAAVRAFQRARGLTADGIVGIATWSALLGA